MQFTIREQAETLIRALQAVSDLYFATKFPILKPAVYGCDFSPQAKYWRVYRDDGSQRFVELFINKDNGDIYYPGGWKAPEPKRVPRFNIADQAGIQRLVEHKSRNHYGYLYLDSITAVDKILSNA